MLTKVLLAPLLVGAVAALCYANSLNGAFVFDDEALVASPDVRLQTPTSAVFANDFWGHPIDSPHSHKSYRPLTILSFRLNVWLVREGWLADDDAAAAGGSGAAATTALGVTPFWFHAGNVALHAAVSVMVWWVALAVLGGDALAAAAAALCFAVHPVHCDAVASVVGRAELLSALCAAAALLVHVHVTTAAAASAGKGTVLLRTLAGLAATAALAVAALLSKEQGVTVLPVCAAYDLVFVGGLELDRSKLRWPADALRPWRLLRSVVRQGEGEGEGRGGGDAGRLCALRIACLAAVTAAALRWRLSLGGGGPSTFTHGDNPGGDPAVAPLVRLHTTAYYAACHAWLLLNPFTAAYSADWSDGSIPLLAPTWGPTAADARHLAFAALAAGLGALLRTATHRDTPPPKRRALAFGLALLMITFLPASHVVRVGFTVAERVLYTPSMGACIVCAALLVLDTAASSAAPHAAAASSAAAAPAPGGRYPPARAGRTRACLACGAVLLLWASRRTWERNKDWRSATALFGSALEVVPNNTKMARALATQHVLEQRYDEAASLLHRALAIDPESEPTRGALGALGAAQGKNEEAAAHYREALRLSTFATVRALNAKNLAISLVKSGDPGGAEAVLAPLISESPASDAGLHWIRGFAFKSAGNLERAERSLSIALKLDRGLEAARRMLGEVRQARGAG
jgi:Flp pilus assembly protein TadD